MAQKDNTAMQFIYVPGKGLSQVTREEAEKILAPVLAKQAKKKAAKEAKIKNKHPQKQK